ncbi:hypothetical protein H5410_055839 [Solanum commersonii]|uniref:Uncharacterized protein n=1 Tax=Solanum commersonii TaxID=4109 RepID=A0A9J5WIN4_SOLCO|nr:hypothetical protein H5410_055839 [Solanum commersonii]
MDINNYSILIQHKGHWDALVTYAIPIEPLPCESTWNIPSHILEEVLLPPITRKQPGRPPSNDRKKGFNEGKYKRSKVTCSKCGISGYTKKLASSLLIRINNDV